MANNRGFTLVELLVAVGIIGVLASISIVSVGSIRSKARDARRLADVKQVQNALELVFNDYEKYPVQATEGTYKLICNGEVADACTTDPDKTYMAMPVNPMPNGTAYKYKSADGLTYSFVFTLENTTNGLAAGAHTASPTGVQ